MWETRGSFNALVISNILRFRANSLVEVPILKGRISLANVLKGLQRTDEAQNAPGRVPVHWGPVHCIEPNQRIGPAHRVHCIGAFSALRVDYRYVLAYSVDSANAISVGMGVVRGNSSCDRNHRLRISAADVRSQLRAPVCAFILHFTVVKPHFHLLFNVSSA